jgi:hypothetical protein
MAAETVRTQTVLESIKTVAASAVPTPGDGPVLFADSADRPTTTIRAKTPDGSTKDVIPQSGVATLVAGVTALISATITTSSRIVAFVKTPGTPTLTVQYGALATDRVAGLGSALGGFKLTALVAAGTINVDDTSVLDWVVFN